MSVSIDSNLSSLYFAEELTLKVLPTTPAWYPLEPNSYPDYGPDYKNIARSFINPTRQRQKGTISDLDVTGGLNTDYTQNGLWRLLQGFLFADVREKPKSNPLNTLPSVVITGSTATTGGAGTINATAGTQSGWVTAGFKVNHLVMLRGWLTSNGLYKATAVTAGALTLTPVDNRTSAADVINIPLAAIATEAANATAQRVEVVGYQLASDAALTGLYQGGGVVPTTLTSSATDLTTLGLIPGEFIHIGDNSDTRGNANATNYNFVNGGGNVRGFGRVQALAAGKITFDLVTFAQGTSGNAAAAPSTSGFVNIYFGAMIRNELTSALIKRRTYTLQRYLGKGVGDLDITEALRGAVPNELSLKTTANDKITSDLTFVAMAADQTNVASLTGTYSSEATGETPFNTSQDIFATLLYRMGSTAFNANVFAYATDVNTSLKNNVEANKAIGVVGGFEASVGMLDVSGTLTAYFNDATSLTAIKNNAKVGLTQIFTKENSGTLLDLPMLTLGGGRNKIEANKPIMEDLTFDAAAGGPAANTITFVKFPYLPDAAMSNYGIA